MRQVMRTALVRVKEREAAEAKKRASKEVEQASRELQLAEQIELEQERRHIEKEKTELEAEQKRLEQDRRLIEQKRVELEAEQKRQTGLIEQQTREAEAQKLREEQTEDFPLEIEVEGFRRDESPNQPEEAEEFYLQVPEMETTTSPDVVAYSAAVREMDAPVEFSDMFAEPQKDSNFMRRMAAAAVILIVVGGAAWGIWTFALSTPNQSNQAVSSSERGAPNAETTPPLPVESAVVPNAETTPETAAPTSASPEIVQTAVTSPAAKNKPVAAPTVKKPNPVAAKTPPAEKKPVTVDDLINDN